MMLTRVLRALERAMIAAGGIWVYVPPLPPLDGPGPGHPESVARGGPLSAAERDLDRALFGECE
ncbi:MULTISPECIES: DUF6059 family protein [Actinomycetes]|uniref:DUF6059 family protein n=2 Tax=Streptomyces TaxID=1883 RepID=A0ABW7S9H7_STRTE|nr:DUF6059 family protein [Streptomyces sp. RK23]